ncbi:MAG: hypothetical protein HY954_05185 [Deltaproteobacteria bacterium]|nr:hypothetical protein [Deltaproteobacteria bacterium]
MRLPTDITITSHRAGIGKVIVAYKKLVQKLISPYLKNVFENEHRILEERFHDLEHKRIASHEAMDSRLTQEEAFTNDLIKKVDIVARLLHKRQEDINCQYEGIYNKLETLRLRFEDHLDNAPSKVDPEKISAAYAPLLACIPADERVFVAGSGLSTVLESIKQKPVALEGASGIDAEAALIQRLQGFEDGSLGAIFISHLEIGPDPCAIIAGLGLRKLKHGGFMVFRAANRSKKLHSGLTRHIFEGAGFKGLETWFLTENGEKCSLSSADGKSGLDKSNSIMQSAYEYALIAKRIG